MSGFDQLPSWLRRRRDISGNAKVIWAFLRPLGPKGITVGQRLIGEQCGVDPKTVRRCIRELDAAGLVRIEQVGQRRARYHTIVAEPDTCGGETPPHVRENLPGEPPPPTGGEPPPPTGRTSPTVREKRPHTVGENLPHDHTPDLNQTTPDLGARAREGPSKRRDPDPDTIDGRWRIFEGAWLRRHGGHGLGLLGGRERLQLEQLRSIPSDRWAAEVDAWLDELAASDWLPDRPWAHFVKHAGQWARRRSARAERSERGRTVIPDHVETGRMLARSLGRGPSAPQRLGDVLRAADGDLPW